MVYARQIANAQRAIREKGELCTWKTVGIVISNPATPWVKTDDPIDYPAIPIAWLPVGNIGKESQVARDDGETVQGYFKGLMGAVPFSPKKKDTVLRGSDNKLYRIESIETINVNGEAILHKIMFVL